MKTLNHKYNDIISWGWSHNYHNVSRERILDGLEKLKSNLKISESDKLPAIEEDIKTVSSGAAFNLRIDHRIPGEHNEYVEDYAYSDDLALLRQYWERNEYVEDYARCVYEKDQQEARPRVYYTYD